MSQILEKTLVFPELLVNEASLPEFPSISRKRYLDENFYQLEIKHVFKKSWLLIGHDSEYEKVGSYRLLDLDLAPVVVVRGKDNKIRAFLNSCQHRGATVLKERQGCTKVMSCQYHGWTYNLEGKLVGVTEEHTFPHLKPEDHSLVELRCEQWGGLIFINFDKEAANLLDWLTPRVVDSYSPIMESPLRIVWRNAWEFNCNWKLAVDAFREAYHIDTVHKQTVAQMLDCKNARFELNNNGHDSIVVPYRAELLENQETEWDAVASLSTLAKLPDIKDRDIRKVVIEPNLFPNISLAIQDVGFPVFSMWPEGVNKTRVEAFWLGVDWGDAPKPEEWDMLTAGSDAVAAEDLANLMSMQKSLEADPDKGIPLATKEVCIYQHHAEIDRLIGKENIPEELRVPDLLRDYFV